MKRYYSFSSTEHIEDKDALDLIGIRGKRAMELATLGAPILPGFMLPNETINSLIQKPSEAKKFLIEPLGKMERVLGKRFNDEKNPMLVKVVESPQLNMITAFSIHNIGLCEKTIGGFSTFVGEEFAYHEYRNVIIKLIELERKCDIDGERNKKLEAFGKSLKASKKQNKIRELIEENKALFPVDIFSNAYDQLLYMIERFGTFFKTSSSNIDSAILIQAMTFGNYGEESYFGSYYTRNIITGENDPLHGSKKPFSQI
jgi:pyruvate,orthophosphate dikinase